ncbi:MAG: ATP synthase subunit I [Acidimicrobiales bacterium]
MSAAAGSSASASAPELAIARDIVRRGAPFAPLAVLAGFAGWRGGGALSAGFALALVAANFLLAAAIMTRAVRISLPALLVGVLGGYVLRLALLMGAVLLVARAEWFEPIPLGFTLIVFHLGLLVWETRYVSASLAFPGLKPPPRRPASASPAPSDPARSSN